ncbi:MAG: phosphotransferase [Akkermansiaceae bacterium]|nr:phosphotransferase [Akkermansiaceae bacterium]
MLHQLALRLIDLHALGYVHRDLKPGNVMWLPRQNRWTIIDFGCAARTGEPARLGFSLAYAAPEVIAAYRNGEDTMIAQVW